MLKPPWRLLPSARRPLPSPHILRPSPGTQHACASASTVDVPVPTVLPSLPLGPRPSSCVLPQARDGQLNPLPVHPYTHYLLGTRVCGPRHDPDTSCLTHPPTFCSRTLGVTGQPPRCLPHASSSSWEATPGPRHSARTQAHTQRLHTHPHSVTHTVYVNTCSYLAHVHTHSKYTPTHMHSMHFLTHTW